MPVSLPFTSLSLSVLRIPALLAVTGAALAGAVITPSPALASSPAPDLPDVRAEASLQVQGSWTGHLTFGMHTSGRARTERPLPLDMHLSRTTCDMTGCMTTQIVVDPAAAVPGVSRVSGKLAGASLSRATIAVTVRRVLNGSVAAEYPATMTVHVKAERSGPVVKRTTLTQTTRSEVLTVTRLATVRATVTIGDEALPATGEISRSKIVD